MYERRKEKLNTTSSFIGLFSLVYLIVNKMVNIKRSK